LRRGKNVPAANEASRRWLFLFLALIIPSLASGQTWSEPFTPATMPSLQFRWRVYGVDTKSQKNVFEWIFSNESDTSVAFNYRLETNRHETRSGRIYFKPRKKQLSGWLFAGDSLISVEVDRKPFAVKQ
jgi:hypothetical protein